MPFGGSWIAPGTIYVLCVPHSRHLKHCHMDDGIKEFIDKVQISAERNYRVSPLRQHQWGCGKLLPLANISSSLFFLGTQKGHACSHHWVQVWLREPWNVSKVTYVLSRWWLVHDHGRCSSPATVVEEPWVVKAAAGIAQPPGGPCSGELPGGKADLSEQETHPCCWKPMHGRGKGHNDQDGAYMAHPTCSSSAWTRRTPSKRRTLLGSFSKSNSR